MKLAWFTPFTKNSAIGKYSQVVTNELSKYVDVDLWLSESSNMLPTELKVVRYRPGENLSKKLENYDFYIYNMGNFLDFHKDIYEVSKVNKGIIILHDFVMHHFFTGYYFLHKNDSNAYIKDMGRFYGEAGINIALNSLNGKQTPIWDTNDVIKYPLFEKVIDNAEGVIVHSKYFAEKANPKFLGPVGTIYFPFYSCENLANNSKVERSVLGLPKDKLIAVTIGHVNRNKRIKSVIEVLADDKELAKKIQYIIIGTHTDKSYSTHIKSIVKENELEEAIRFLGFQPEDKLRAYMENADIFINLRYPAMEGASWSLIEEMYFGKPIIVIDTGFYAEIPDDCAIKINPLNEKADLLRLLRKLTDDEYAREKIGKMGQTFAVENFNTNKYCNSFLEFLTKVKESKPMIDLIDKVGEELVLMGANENMSALNKAANEIYEMFRR